MIPSVLAYAASLFLAAAMPAPADFPPQGERVAAEPKAVYDWAARHGLDLKGWELESIDDSSAAFYARNVPVGPMMRLTMRLEYFRPAPLTAAQAVRSVSAVVEVDCTGKRARYLETRLYARNALTDFIRKDPDTGWAPLDPDNVHDGYFQDRCEGR